MSKAILISSIGLVALLCVSYNVHAEDDFDAKMLPDQYDLSALDGLPVHSANQTSDVYKITDALKEIYLSNPEILASREELKSIAEQLPQATSNWRPTIDSTAQFLSSQTSPDTFGSATGESEVYSLDLSQPLFRGGRTVSEIAAAKNRYRAQEAVLLDAEQSVFLRGVQSYMDVVRDQRIERLRDNNVTVLARQMEATQDRFDLGELTLTDVSQAKARHADAKAQQIQAQGILDVSKAAFESVVGKYPVDLEMPDVSWYMLPSLSDVIAKAEQLAPNIRLANYNQQASKNDVRTVEGELWPSLNLNGNARRQMNPTFGTAKVLNSQSLTLQATVPLYSSGSVRSRIRQAKYIENQKKIEILDARRTAKENVTRAWHTYTSALAVIVSREAQVEAERVALEGVREEEAFGTRTILDILDAEQEYLDAQVNLVSAEYEFVISVYEILAAVGQLTAERLNLAVPLFKPDDFQGEIRNKWFKTNIEK